MPFVLTLQHGDSVEHLRFPAQARGVRYHIAADDAGSWHILAGAIPLTARALAQLLPFNGMLGVKTFADKTFYLPRSHSEEVDSDDDDCSVTADRLPLPLSVDGDHNTFFMHTRDRIAFDTAGLEIRLNYVKRSAIEKSNLTSTKEPHGLKQRLKTNETSTPSSNLAVEVRSSDPLAQVPTDAITTNGYVSEEEDEEDNSLDSVIPARRKPSSQTPMQDSNLPPFCTAPQIIDETPQKQAELAVIDNDLAMPDNKADVASEADMTTQSEDEDEARNNQSIAAAVAEPRPQPRAAKRRAAAEANGNRLVPSLVKRQKRAAAAGPVVSSLPSSQPTKSSPRCKKSGYTGPSPVILTSNTAVPNSPALLKFLTTKGAVLSTSSIETRPERDKSNFLCVGPDSLKTTAKVLLSLLRSKTIVTDQWCLDSMKANRLLDPAPFLPTELQTHANATSDAIDRTLLFARKTFYFTPAVKKIYGTTGAFADIEQVIKEAGGRSALFRSAESLHTDENVDSANDGLGNERLVIALDGQDKVVVAACKKAKVACYRKELITMSVIKGKFLAHEADMKI